MLKFDKEKLKQLQAEERILNYRELCEFIDIPAKTGNAKVSQIKEIDTICRREFVSATKFKVVEVYDVFVPKADKRSRTLSSIETIMMNILSNDDRLTRHNDEGGGVLFASNTDLIYWCGMINENYKSLLNNSNLQIYIADKFGFDDDFLVYIDNTESILKTSIRNALESMKKRNEIADTQAFKVKPIKEDGADVYCTVVDPLGIELYNIRGVVDVEMHLTNHSTFFEHPDLAMRYYDRCNELCLEYSKTNPLWIKNRWEFCKFYDSHALTLSVDKVKYDIHILGKAKAELNDICKDKITTSKTMRDLTLNSIDKHFLMLNTREGDEKYNIVEEIKIKNYLDKNKNK